MWLRYSKSESRAKLTCREMKGSIQGMPETGHKTAHIDLDAEYGLRRKGGMPPREIENALDLHKNMERLAKESGSPHWWRRTYQSAIAALVRWGRSKSQARPR